MKQPNIMPSEMNQAGQDNMYVEIIGASIIAPPAVVTSRA